MVKKYLRLAVTIFTLINQSIAQEKTLKNQIALFGSFYTLNGSGDIPGFVMSAEYGGKFKKRLEFLPSVTFTSHFEENRHFTTYNGVTYDQKIRFITSGFQADLKFAYVPIDKKLKLKLIVGPIVRLQYDNYPSGGYSANFPALTGYPGILYEFYEDDRTGNKFKELNIGYIVGPSVDYMFKNNWFISTRFLIQSDTNADFIASGFIGFGKRF